MDDTSSSNSSSFLPLESAREADGESNRIGGGREFGCKDPLPLWLMTRAARFEGEGELGVELKEVSKSENPCSDAENGFGSLRSGVEEGEGGYLKVRVVARGVMGG